MKRIFMFAIFAVMLFSVTVYSVFAGTYLYDRITGETYYSGDGRYPCIPLDRDKIIEKAYSKAELTSYLNGLYEDGYRIADTMTVRCELGEEAFTAQAVMNTLGRLLEYEANDYPLLGYSQLQFSIDESELYDTILRLLEEGYDAAPANILLPDDFFIVLHGDIDMSGEVNAFDYMIIKRGVLGTYTFDETQALLADANRNGKIDLADYMMVKRHVLGTYKITYGEMIR